MGQGDRPAHAQETVWVVALCWLLGGAITIEVEGIALDFLKSTWLNLLFKILV
jgi:hypothetical protein